MYVKELIIRDSSLYMRGTHAEHPVGDHPPAADRLEAQMGKSLRECLFFEHVFLEACPVKGGDGKALLDDIRPAVTRMWNEIQKASPIDRSRDWKLGLRYHERLVGILTRACAESILSGKGISFAFAKDAVKALCREAEEDYRDVEKYLDDVVTVNSAAMSPVPGAVILYREDIDASVIVSEEDYDNKGHLLVKDRYEWIPEKECPFHVLSGPLEGVPEKYREQMEALEHSCPPFSYRPYLDVPDKEESRQEAEEFFSKFGSVSNAVLHMYYDPDAMHYYRAVHIYLDQTIVGYKMTGFKTWLWYCPRKN